MKRLAALVLLGFLALPAPAAPQSMHAHPALWRVEGDHASVALFGSVHVLAPNVDWQTQEVKRAIKAAQVFVFEVPLDTATIGRVSALMSERGSLPPGQSLRQMLPPDSRADLDKAVAATQLPEAAVDNKRPWLVSLMLVSAHLQQHQQQFALGADSVVLEQATKAKKPIRYLETADQQLALIAPSDPKVELQSLEEELKSFATEDADIAAITGAWEKGDTAALDALSSKEFVGQPEARATFFTDRNRNWVKQIEAMLRERKTFFITVGAGHLVGKDGVPALLRADGYRVQGP
jgi:hypothetical protein